MSDWEIVQDNNQQSQSSSDWEVVPAVASSMKPQPDESLGMSALKAIPRIKEDLYKGVAGAIMAAPEYYKKAKTEVPGLIPTVLQHPISAAKQGMAGLTEMGHELINTPASIVDYGVNRLHLLPESASKNVLRQPDISGDINNVFGQPQHPGEALLRGLGRNSVNLLGTKGLITGIKNFIPTEGKIIKNVLNTEKQMKAKYSGQNGLYNQLSEEAKSRGMNLDHINPKDIDIETIKKYTSPKHTEALDAFLKDKNLTTAQKAISDLGYIERRLDSKMTLLEPEKEQLKAVRDAKNYIQENMFKDKEGITHYDLLDKHKAIQKGYATEVIPYTKNQAIQSYKKGEKLPGEMVSSISRGKFAAQRGKFHPEIARRKKFEKISKNPFAKGIGLGVGGLTGVDIGKGLYDEMFGSGSHE